MRSGRPSDGASSVLIAPSWLLKPPGRSAPIARPGPRHVPVTALGPLAEKRPRDVGDHAERIGEQEWIAPREPRGVDKRRPQHAELGYIPTEGLQAVVVRWADALPELSESLAVDPHPRRKDEGGENYRGRQECGRRPAHLGRQQERSRQ